MPDAGRRSTADIVAALGGLVDFFASTHFSWKTALIRELTEAAERLEELQTQRDDALAAVEWYVNRDKQRRGHP